MSIAQRSDARVLQAVARYATAGLQGADAAEVAVDVAGDVRRADLAAIEIGQRFAIRISVDDNYMFTIEQIVGNLERQSNIARITAQVVAPLYRDARQNRAHFHRRGQKRPGLELLKAGDGGQVEHFALSHDVHHLAACHAAHPAGRAQRQQGIPGTTVALGLWPAGMGDRESRESFAVLGVRKLLPADALAAHHVEPVMLGEPTASAQVRALIADEVARAHGYYDQALNPGVMRIAYVGGCHVAVAAKPARQQAYQRVWLAGGGLTVAEPGRHTVALFDIDRKSVV